MKLNNSPLNSPIADFEVPDGALVYGTRMTPFGPMFGVQHPGEPRPLELFPEQARAYVEKLKAKGGRGRMAKQMIACIVQVEYDRNEMGLPMNAPPTMEQQALLQAHIMGQMKEMGLDTVGGVEPEEGGTIFGIVRRGEYFRVCIHSHGQPPVFMTANEARQQAGIAESEGKSPEAVKDLRELADECDRLTALKDAGGLTAH